MGTIFTRLAAKIGIYFIIADFQAPTSRKLLLQLDFAAVGAVQTLFIVIINKIYLVLYSFWPQHNLVCCYVVIVSRKMFVEDFSYACVHHLNRVKICFRQAQRMFFTSALHEFGDKTM